MFKISSTKFKALLFDMDGTLINSEPTHYKAMDNTLKKYGKNYVDFETHKKIYTGTGIHNVASKEIERNNLNEDVDEIKSNFHQTLEGIIEVEGLQPMSGAITLLKAAKEKGFKLAVVSGSITSLIEYSLQKSGIPNLFDEIIGADKFGNPKPDPACYLLAADFLSLSPSECLVFEDAPNGLLAGKNAGMEVVAIGETLTKEQLENIDPNIVHLKDFTEIEII